MFLLNLVTISLLFVSNTQTEPKKEVYFKNLKTQEYTIPGEKKTHIYVKIPTPLVKNNKNSN